MTLDNGLLFGPPCI